MTNNRDDFTERTKRKMAGRVGYICSKPGCNAYTIGASSESNDATSITGVAAHICAAAPGGKRYDPSMTPEERKSIDNGIWLCQTHARLIDTDESKYTVELLKEWKREAEEQAAKRLADANFINNYYMEHGHNLSALESIFDNFIDEGDFKNLALLLSHYTSDLGEVYDEFILRYKIIYCIYCDRVNLPQFIEKYLKLSYKEGIDDIIKLCISLDLKQILSQIVGFSNDEKLKELAGLIISEQLIGKVSFEIDETVKKTKPKFTVDACYFDCVNKYVSYYIFSNKLCNMGDGNGGLFNISKEGFFFECLHNSFQMSRISLGIVESSISQYNNFFKNNINRINDLDMFYILIILFLELEVECTGRTKKSDVLFLFQNKTPDLILFGLAFNFRILYV